jgi:hypothetical protein
MKNTLIIASFLVLCSSCQKSDGEYSVTEQKWEIGQMAASDTRTIDNIQQDGLTFKIDRGSLCPTNGVKLTIKEGKSLLLEKRIEIMPFDTLIVGSKKLEISTETYSVEKPPAICVFLGSAECTISF